MQLAAKLFPTTLRNRRRNDSVGCRLRRCRLWLGRKSASDDVQFLPKSTDIGIELAGAAPPLSLSDPGSHPADQHPEDENGKNYGELRERHRVGRARRRERIERNRHRGTVGYRERDDDHRERNDNQRPDDFAEHWRYPRQNIDGRDKPDHKHSTPDERWKRAP